MESSKVSLSLDGKTLAVSGKGSIRTYIRKDNQWELKGGELIKSGELKPIIYHGKNISLSSDGSLALINNTLYRNGKKELIIEGISGLICQDTIISSNNNIIYIYHYLEQHWKQPIKFKGDNGLLSHDGSILCISYSGETFVYGRKDNLWNPIIKLLGVVNGISFNGNIITTLTENKILIYTDVGDDWKRVIIEGSSSLISPDGKTIIIQNNKDVIIYYQNDYIWYYGIHVAGILGAISNQTIAIYDRNYIKIYNQLKETGKYPGTSVSLSSDGNRLSIGGLFNELEMRQIDVSDWCRKEISN
jgi:hypothetical protein